MAAITFDTHPLYKRLVYAGMTEEQAETQIEVMIDISKEMNLDKSIAQQNKSFWKEMVKTFFWTWIISMLIVCVIAIEIVGLKHIHFT